MNILVLVINHGTKQKGYCEKLIESFNDMQGYSFTVKVFSSEICGFRNCDEIKGSKFSDVNFILNAYDYMRYNDVSFYDYILLTDNDLLYSKENFDTFFKHRTSDAYTIGFVLYEEKAGVRYVVGQGHGRKSCHLRAERALRNTQVIDLW
jgi:hypothetical protein